MNTAKLKTFARKARTLLRAGVAQKVAFWGFDDKGTVTAEPETIAGGYIFRERIGDDAQLPDRWQKLRSTIRAHGVDEVIERAAYTWFNRLIALKILEQNGYEQPQLEFTDATTQQPRLLQRARQGQTGFLDAREQRRLQPLLADYTQETAAFGVLLVGFCHQQHHVLNRVFGRIDDYTELLLPDDLLATGGFLDLLNTTDAITPEDYKRVELIGWLYQFYISEKKDEVFAKFKKSQKAEAADIPAATQIFTPNWIVKYLVENTLGRTWLDHHPTSTLANSMRYYVVPATVENAEPVPAETAPAFATTLFDKPVNQSTPFTGDVMHLTCLDPAVGSGHMLVEAFDLLMRVYQEEYYLAGEAVRSILQHNLFGLDLDERAAQLARFALLMKAAQYDATILSETILPRVYAMPEPAGFSRADLMLFLGDGREHEPALADALSLMQQAQNLGSLMRFDLTADARDYLLARWQTLEMQSFRTLAEELILTNLRPFLAVLELLTRQYACLTANPPYMGAGNMNNQLKLYVNQHYARSKADLFAVFMEVIPRLCKDAGRFGIINLPSWLFITSFETLRRFYLDNFHIESLLHMGRGIFGIDFGSVAFCVNKQHGTNLTGSYFRLHKRNFQHIHFTDIEKLFLYSKNQPSYRYDFDTYRDNEGTNLISSSSVESGIKLFYSKVNQIDFNKIPSTPIAYWTSKQLFSLFEKNPTLSSIAAVKHGLSTGKNEAVVREWHEISNNDFGKNFESSEEAFNSGYKWFPYNKGGEFRRWYGNQEHVLRYDNYGQKLMLSFSGHRHDGKSHYFKSGITWSFITTGNLGIRYTPSGFAFDVSGSTLFVKDPFMILGILCSKVADYILNILNPTINFQVGNLKTIPIVLVENKVLRGQIIDDVSNCIDISKHDWNSRETSWDFVKNPLVAQEQPTLEAAYSHWEAAVTQDFGLLHQNEEELNRIFIDLYGLQDELTSEVPLKDITILQEELERSKLTAPGEALPIKRDMVMQQFISYAIGCLMGRYRLDQNGLHIAHPNPTPEEVSANSLIDADGIIPLMGDRSAFADDAVGRVRAFIQLVWGDDSFTRNLNFLQAALDRDLDAYLVRDFWGHHVRRYQKKPIYWLFSSPKGAFQVLVYMHRMNKFTAEKIRTNYLLRHLQHLQRSIAGSSTNTTLNKADAKQLDQLRRDLLECEAYDLLLKDIADRQIDFDLDDGVTRNLALFKGVVAEVR